MYQTRSPEYTLTARCEVSQRYCKNLWMRKLEKSGGVLGWFHSVDGFLARSGLASFDKSGYFEATSFQPGDGLFPGTYKVGIQCWKSPSNMEGGPVISFIDRKYNSVARSPLDQMVLEKEADDVELDIENPSGK